MGLTHETAIAQAMRADEGWLGDNFYEATCVDADRTYRLQITFTEDVITDLDMTYPSSPWRHHVTYWRDHNRIEPPQAVADEVPELLARRLFKDHLFTISFEKDPVYREYAAKFGFRFLYGAGRWQWYDMRYKVSMSLVDLEAVNAQARALGVDREDVTIFNVMSARVMKELPEHLDRVFPHGSSLVNHMPNIEMWLASTIAAFQRGVPSSIDPSQWRSATGMAWEDVRTYVRLDASIHRPVRREELSLTGGAKRRVRV